MSIIVYKLIKISRLRNSDNNSRFKKGLFVWDTRHWGGVSFFSVKSNRQSRDYDKNNYL